jgi:predicted transcriptional regulator
MYGMTPGMKRTTIYLPTELKDRLEEASRRRGVTEAEIIRVAVDKELTRGLRGAGILTDPLPDGVSGRTLHEHMEGFGEE